MKKVIFFLIYLHLAYPLFAQSPETVVLQKANDLLRVGKQSYYLEDKTGKLTIEEIQQLDKQNKFTN